MDSNLQTQKPLSVLLDEIEERAKTALPVNEATYRGWDASDLLTFVATDVPALVKALCRAMITAKIMPSEAYVRITDNFKVDMLPNDLQADYDTLEQELAALLNQGRQ